MNGAIAIIEDEKKLLDLLVMNLGDEFPVAAYSSAEEFLERGGPASASVILTDVRLPGIDGIELLERLKAERPRLPVIVMTAFSSVDQAVTAVKAGAYDYLTKPVRMSRVADVIRNALNFERSVADADGDRAGDAPFSDEFLTRDPLTGRQLDLAVRVARKDVPVLVLGETGTGKDLVSRLIHERSGRRGPLVVMNCAAIPADLVEGELFGYGKGAFTGAASSYDGKAALADGGTLFLDEIGDMPSSVQAKLLRVIETGTFYPLGDNRERRSSFRVVAATNRDLRASVDGGAFRRDLYYRIAVVPIRIPPLRERPADIRPLAERFFREALAADGAGDRPVHERVYEIFESYRWPGNVREMKSVVMRMVLASDFAGIFPRDFPRDIDMPPPFVHGPAASYEDLKNLKKIAREDAAGAIEREFISSLLERYGYNATRAAKAARMDRRLLQNLARKHGVGRPPAR